MANRKYLPTIADLIDRLSIDTLKSIKLGNNNPKKKANYEEEAREIIHDLNILLKAGKIKDVGMFIRAVQVNMLTNETIWANESFVRAQEAGHLTHEQIAKHLSFTHTINGMRMRAGNILAKATGQRIDMNLDRVNDPISAEMGYDWNGLF